MTLSIKPEVHNLSQGRQRRIEPRPQATCIKIWWSSAARFLSYACGQTNKHTDKQTCTYS